MVASFPVHSQGLRRRTPPRSVLITRHDMDRSDFPDTRTMIERETGITRRRNWPRPVFASLTTRDRHAIVARLDEALWWMEGAHLARAVTVLLRDLDPDYGDNHERASRAGF